MKIDAKTLDEIRQDTELNDHCGALLTAAKALGCKDYSEKIERIIRERNRLGYLDWTLSHLYHEQRIELMQFAKENMTESDFNELHGCF